MGSLASLQLPFSILIVIVVASHSFPSNEVSALTAFKQAIYEDPSMVLSNWNQPGETPCSWSGVFCSISHDYVTKINVSASNLKGFLAPELGQLSQLEELVLHGNNLIGILPKEIGKLKNLKVLDLGMNQLTGPIPPQIGNLSSIKTINLESNGFTGKLPPELGDLKYLEELRLDRNRLQGSVPASNSSNFETGERGMYASNPQPTGLCRSPQLKIADLSYNFFVGSIPKCLEYLPRSSFQGNCLQDRELKQRPTAQCGKTLPGKVHAAPPEKKHSRADAKHQSAEVEPKHRGASRPSWLLTLEIVTAVMVGSLFIIALLTAFQKFKSRSSIIIPWKKSASEKEHLTVYIDPEILKDVKRYTRQELEVACEDFSNIIGSSSDSLVYKGNLRGGPEVAVISLCIKEEHWTGYLELYYQKEVADLSRLNHENIGKLLGYSREDNPFTRMLVFEYASNGTLHEHLHYGDAFQLSWTRRMNIVIGISRGLKYLLGEPVPAFTISELNSSAVYLTEDFSPKLVDFESWKMILARSDRNSGSLGNGHFCVRPDSPESRHLDVKANIYDFGVLLLEIVSGKQPHSEGKGSLVHWAKEYLDMPEAMSYVVDPELKHFRFDDLKVICEVVSLCIDPDPRKRPVIQDICTMLECGVDTSASSEVKASSLAWAEIALSS